VDDIDREALRALLANGRLSWAELAQQLGLSPPAAADRVRRLEERGVIRGYTALLDPAQLDCELAALVAVTLERPAHRAAFLRWVQASAEVLECHHVAGDDDYLLKVRCSSTRALEQLVSDGIKALPGIIRTRTTVVLSTIKETAALPLTGPRPRRTR
jgi:Lrp/AsnC family leucine-responsive transcriptional regulator